MGEALASGMAKRAPELGPLDIMLQVPFSLGEPDPASLQGVRDMLALYIGGMGAPEKNFYNQLARRYGFVEEAEEIQRLYLSGRKAEAADAVPDELVHAISLIGTREEVGRQLEEFAEAGVTTLLLVPMSASTSDRIRQVGELAALEKARRHAG